MDSGLGAPSLWKECRSEVEGEGVFETRAGEFDGLSAAEETIGGVATLIESMITSPGALLLARGSTAIGGLATKRGFLLMAPSLRGRPLASRCAFDGAA